MDIFVRLWVPDRAEVEEVEQMLHRCMMLNTILPPFTEELQAEVFRLYGTQGPSTCYRFRIVFPRGPVMLAERLPFRMSPPSVGRNLLNVVPYRASARVEPHLRMDPDNPFLNPSFVVPLMERSRQRMLTRRTIQLPTHECTMEDTCAVCLEKMKVGDTVCTLGCTHTFHKTCIENWVRRKTNCPVCRYEM